MTNQEIQDDIVEQVELRYRLNRADNLLQAPPTTDELEANVWDALADINSAPPQTFFTLETVYEGTDTRWKTLLFLGVAKHHLQMLNFHWTSEGFTASLEDMEEGDKVDSYQSLLSQITEQFDDKLEKLKLTSQKFIRGVAGPPQTNIMGSSVSISSSSIIRRF